MFCMKCGANMPSGAAVCPFCATPAEAKTPSRVSPERLLSKPLLIITATLLVFQFIISAYQLFGKGISGPEMLVNLGLFMIFLFPMIFEIVGMYKLGAYSAKPYSSPGCGFLKTSYIIRIIYNAIFTVGMIIYFLVSAVMVSELSRFVSEDYGGLVILLAILCLTVQVLKICYYSSMIGVANMTNEKLTGTLSTQNYSLFPVVLNFFVIMFRAVLVMVILVEFAQFSNVWMYVPVSGGALFLIVLIQLIVSCLRVVMGFVARAKVSKENYRNSVKKPDTFSGAPIAPPSGTQRSHIPTAVSPYITRNSQETENHGEAYPDYERTYRSDYNRNVNNESGMKKPDSLD